MKRRSLVVGTVGAALAGGLMVTSVGWYLSASAGHEEDFSSCRFEGDTLVLTFSHGTSTSVEPTIDARGEDLVVSLRTRSGGGITPAIALTSEVRFQAWGGPSTVRYRDGRELECKRVDATPHPRLTRQRGLEESPSGSPRPRQQE